MSEEQVLKYLLAPVLLVLFTAGFGLALAIPLLALIFYLGSDL